MKHFFTVKPSIKTKNQIALAEINDKVILECFVEASPKSLTTWYSEDGILYIQLHFHTIGRILICQFYVCLI